MLNHYNMSLTDQDLEKIGDIQMNMLIKFWDEILEKNLVTKNELGGLKDELKNTEVRINKKLQDSRDYIDMRIREYSGETVKRDRTLDIKGNKTADLLHSKQVFTQEDTTKIKTTNPFSV